jgi:GH15 family glucan-1,4-alpha-glucosidase
VDVDTSPIPRWVAFDRAIKSVEQFGLAGPADKWHHVRNEIHRQVCDNGFNAAHGAYHPGTCREVSPTMTSTDRDCPSRATVSLTVFSTPTSSKTLARSDMLWTG